jgi:very-short-patch-repair endonuclease
MHPVAALRRLGGVADRGALLQLTSRGRLRAAVRRGAIVRDSRNCYALPTADEGLRAAVALAGTASHATAAAIHRWQLARQPALPSVIVPRKRNLSADRRRGVDVRHRDLRPEERRGRVTEVHRTVIDCAKDLLFQDALAIADSALRHRSVDRDRLLSMAEALPTTGRTQALRVVRSASPLAANPFESVLRAIALDVPGLDVQPQVVISERGFYGRPDLVDRRRRIVIEGDSYTFHGTRKAFRRDCQRYTGLVIRGWTVVRFAWEDVMHEPDYVRDALAYLVAGPTGQAALPPSLLWSA